MFLKCYKCGHSWNYKGRMDYLTCPGCYCKIKRDEALVEEDKIEQRLLTTTPKLISSWKRLPKELPTTTTTTNFEEVEKGIFVEKKLVKQFKAVAEETPLPTELQGHTKEEPIIKVISWLPETIRIIPYDPIKHLEHMQNFF